MTVLNNQFGKNIKYLRTAYGETQLDLVLAVGLDSPNAIANYEKGERTPKPEIKKKIASHYRITEDELVHSDFSGMKVSSSYLGSKQKMIEMTLHMCPIICSEKAMEDSLFQKGYAVHMRALDAMKEGLAFAEADYDMCISAYSDSYDEYETPESLANIWNWPPNVQENIRTPQIELPLVGIFAIFILLENLSMKVHVQKMHMYLVHAIDRTKQSISIWTLYLRLVIELMLSVEFNLGSGLVKF